MNRVRCVNCGLLFSPIVQVPNQTFCSKTDCQKARRRKWQREKLSADSDYRENQARAQKTWTDKNPDYWRELRQRGSISSSSLESPQTGIQDGFYSLQVLAKPVGVKMDVWIVQLTNVHEAPSKVTRRIKR